MCPVFVGLISGYLMSPQGNRCNLCFPGADHMSVSCKVISVPYIKLKHCKVMSIDNTVISVNSLLNFW